MKAQHLVQPMSPKTTPKPPWKQLKTWLNNPLWPLTTLTKKVLSWAGIVVLDFPVWSFAILLSGFAFGLWYCPEIRLQLIESMSKPENARALAGPAGITSVVTFATLSVVLGHTQDDLFDALHKTGKYNLVYETLWIGVFSFGALSMAAFTSQVLPSLFQGFTPHILLFLLFSAMFSLARTFAMLQLLVKTLVMAVSPQDA